MQEEKIKKQILKMLKEIATTDNLVEVRAECLYSDHLWQQHVAKELNLTPEQMVNIVFTLGRASQLGILMGVLWWTNECDDTVEIEGKKLFEEALRTGKPSWRKDD